MSWDPGQCRDNTISSKLKISVSHNTANLMKANEEELCKRIQSHRKFVAGFNFHPLARCMETIKCMNISYAKKDTWKFPIYGKIKKKATVRIIC